MDSLDKLKGMIDSFPSSFGLVKTELLQQVIEVEKEFEDFQDRSITWGVEDFASRAEELEGENWREIYDEDLFEENLYDMIRHHDCNNGVTWDSIDCYLESCKK